MRRPFRSAIPLLSLAFALACDAGPDDVAPRRGDPGDLSEGTGDYHPEDPPGDITDPEPAPTYCFGTGQPWGPCWRGAPVQYGCNDFSLTCLQVGRGWICVPPADEVTPEILACGEAVGGVDCSGDKCVIACPNGHHEECEHPLMVCDADALVCVFPSPTP